MSEFYKQYVCPYDENYSLIIEDDGRVSYAYLLSEGNLISDVWLYNQQEAPDKTIWNREDMPFLNPKEYILIEKSIHPIIKDADVDIKWIYNEDLEEVNIFIRKERIAILKPKLIPGYSSLVSKDGPLAKAMDGVSS